MSSLVNWVWNSKSLHRGRLWLIIPALLVWVLSCWQTVFLCHLAYLFIHLTFTVEEADGRSLGYKFLTPQGLTASITPVCLAEFRSVCHFNQWHMNTIKAEVFKTKSRFNKGIYMSFCTYVLFLEFTSVRIKSQMGGVYSIQRIHIEQSCM